MRPIPPKMKQEMDASGRMKTCCINNLNCRGAVQWHHVWIYAHRQINEIWAIVPACEFHHEKAESPQIKKLFQYYSLRMASDADLAKYPKKDWLQIKKTVHL
jgi:hypothetical protein